MSDFWIRLRDKNKTLDDLNICNHHSEILKEGGFVLVLLHKDKEKTRTMELPALEWSIMELDDSNMYIVKREEKK